MSRVCDVTGQNPMFGNNVSHSKRRCDSACSCCCRDQCDPRLQNAEVLEAEQPEEAVVQRGAGRDRAVQHDGTRAAVHRQGGGAGQLSEGAETDGLEDGALAAH